MDVTYAITRPFSVRRRFVTARCYFFAILVLSAVFLALVAPTIVIAVGYDSVPVLQVSYNATTMRWYDHIKFPKLATTTECQGSVMTVNEGKIFYFNFYC
jgi:hypothetical protein